MEHYGSKSNVPRFFRDAGNTWLALRITTSFVIVLWALLLVWRLFIYSFYPISGYGSTIVILLLVVALFDIIMGIVIVTTRYSDMPTAVRTLSNFQMAATALVVVSLLGFGIKITNSTADLVVFFLAFLCIVLGVLQLILSVALQGQMTEPAPEKSAATPPPYTKAQAVY